MFSIIKSDWLDHFKEMAIDAKEICIISPFITNIMVDHLIKNVGETKVLIITRYNLNDFRSNVSHISALRKLVLKGFKVRGIKSLHSKLYLFDNRCAIISSANFTSGGFFTNYELGIKTLDKTIIDQTSEYFNTLFNVDEIDLTIAKINDWEILINESKPLITNNQLPDFGISPFVKKSTKTKHFIKFFGRSDTRGEKDYLVKDMVSGSHCHFAITFSDGKGRPRRYDDGDIIYLAYMLPKREYAIFGKAVAIKHNDLRDVASKEDIEYVRWKQHYRIYIRVKNPVFINSVMGNCPKMSELIDDLKYQAFYNTNEKYNNEGKELNPWDSLRQQADVRISELGAQWIDNKMNKTIELYKILPDDFIQSLYNPNFKKF